MNITQYPFLTPNFFDHKVYITCYSYILYRVTLSDQSLSVLSTQFGKTADVHSLGDKVWIVDKDPIQRWGTIPWSPLWWYYCQVKLLQLSNNVLSLVAGLYMAYSFSGDGGLATSAKMYYPYGITGDSKFLWISDTHNFRVRRITFPIPASTLLLLGRNSIYRVY